MRAFFRSPKGQIWLVPFFVNSLLVCGLVFNHPFDPHDPYGPIHGPMATGGQTGHGLTKVSLGPGRIRGGPPPGQVAFGRLLPPWTPQAVRLWTNSCHFINIMISLSGFTFSVYAKSSSWIMDPLIPTPGLGNNSGWFRAWDVMPPIASVCRSLGKLQWNWK